MSPFPLPLLLKEPQTELGPEGGMGGGVQRKLLLLQWRLESRTALYPARLQGCETGGDTGCRWRTLDLGDQKQKVTEAGPGASLLTPKIVSLPEIFDIHATQLAPDPQGTKLDGPECASPGREVSLPTLACRSGQWWWGCP